MTNKQSTRDGLVCAKCAQPLIDGGVDFYCATKDCEEALTLEGCVKAALDMQERVRPDHHRCSMNPTKQSPRDGLVPENIEAQIEAWFFRDLYDAHRKALIARCLGDGAADEAHQHGVQRMVLRRIIRSLCTSHPNAAETCPHDKTVEHETGDGTPVTFCPSCGQNFPHPPAPQDDARADVRGLVEEINWLLNESTLSERQVALQGGRAVAPAAQRMAEANAKAFQMLPRILAALNPTGEA